VLTVATNHELKLFYSPPLTAAQRSTLLAEVRQLPDVELRHVDGLSRVRLVLTAATARCCTPSPAPSPTR